MCFKKFLIRYMLITMLVTLCMSSSILAVNDTATDDDPVNGSSTGLDIYAESGILIDAESGKTLYEKNSTTRMYPASTTKLVTAILTLDNCNLDDIAKVSYYSVHSVPYSYSIANLQPGEELTIRELLYSLMVASANDSAYVLAQYIVNKGNGYDTGSSSSAKAKFNEDIATFSDMMNSKAKELGCVSTNFVNPNGIHNENHYSSAYDLALIGKAAYSNSTLRTIASTVTYTLPNNEVYTGDSRIFNTTNLLLRKGRKGYYEYANGLKTGYTDAAGFCIIASSEKNGVNLIAVILNSDNTTNSATSREADCKRLFEYGFNNYSYSNLISSGDVATNINIANGKSDCKSLDLTASSDIRALVHSGEAIDVTPEISITKSSAPISSGEVVGTISYTLDGITYNSDLIATHDVYSASYLNFILILLCTFALLLFLVTIFSNKSKKATRKKNYNRRIY